MQTTGKSFTERSDFLGALLLRQAQTSMGPETSPLELSAYQFGYLIAVITGQPHLYELVIEELASLGVRDPG